MREIVETTKIIPIPRNSKFNEVKSTGKSLIAFPAQCNYNGYKFPLKVIEELHQQDNFILLDAAALLSTSSLDLTVHKPDYVCFSFYKIFGYPSGLGALIVSNRGAKQLKKKYYGGGTVKVVLTRENWHVNRDSIHEKFEDGTVAYLSIISLQSCFKYMENLLGTSFIERISRHVFNLGKYLYEQLRNLKHHNQQPVALLYQDTNFDDNDTQGGIVNFNLMHDDGAFIGYGEFSCMASLHNFTLRAGCFCNPGSCQTHLKLTNEDVMTNYNSGRVCGSSDYDLINGRPTGSIRISFGYMNAKDEIDEFIEFIKKCYVHDRIVMSRDHVKLNYR